MHIARKAYKDLYMSAVSIQTGMRGMAARYELRFRRRTRAAIVIQVENILKTVIIRYFKHFYYCHCPCILYKIFVAELGFKFLFWFKIVFPSNSDDFFMAEPLPKILGTNSFYEIKEGSNYHTMCMERKSCTARIAPAQDGNPLNPS